MLCPFKNAFNLGSGLPCLGWTGLLTLSPTLLEVPGAGGPLYFGNDGVRETERHQGYILTAQLRLSLVASSSESEQVVISGCKVSYAT